MESPYLSQDIKDSLVQRRALLNPVVLQDAVHKAVGALFAAQKAEVAFHYEAPAFLVTFLYEEHVIFPHKIIFITNSPALQE
ncbi:MAG: hypothetical protein LBQ89_02935 [Treponema sp.]|jgi:hypothetical protein|nr:hypothetical protein [Treponema sp.]